MKVNLVDKENNIKQELELTPEVFGVEVSVPLLHQVVTMQLAKRRRGTASTKTRSEVRGGGIKPWRQKGTGRARSGSSRNPIWVGGGCIFGPHPRSYDFSVPKKMRKKALKGALSAKASQEELVVVDSLEMAEPKTKQVIACLAKLGLDKQKVLIVEVAGNENLLRSVRNIPGVDFLPVEGLNVYDLLWHDKLLLTQAALDKIEERLTG